MFTVLGIVQQRITVGSTRLEIDPLQIDFMPCFFIGAQAAALARKLNVQATIVDMRSNTHFSICSSAVHLTVEKGNYDNKIIQTTQKLWEYIIGLKFPDVYTAAELKRLLPQSYQLHNREPVVIKAETFPRFIQCFNEMVKLELSKQLFGDKLVVFVDPFDPQAILIKIMEHFDPIIVGLSRCWSFVSPSEADNFLYLIDKLKNPGRFLFSAHQQINVKSLEVLQKLSACYETVFASDFPATPVILTFSEASRPSIAVRQCLDILLKNTYQLVLDRSWIICEGTELPETCRALESRLKKGDYVVQQIEGSKQQAGKVKKSQAVMLTVGSTWGEILEFAHFIAAKWDFARSL